MNKLQKIIFDLLYKEEDMMIFNISNMCDHIEDYTDFTNDIICEVNKGEVFIIEDSIKVIDNNEILWEVKVKRN